MTDGMKSGAGSDPFADDSGNDEESSTGTAEETRESEPQASPASESELDTTTQSDGSSNSASNNLSARTNLPYIFRRNGVKEDRKMIQYFLRDNTEDIETDAKYAVEQELGTDVYLTDLREALVRVGAEHIDEVADELREWGYQYQEE